MAGEEICEGPPYWIGNESPAKARARSRRGGLWMAAGGLLLLIATASVIFQRPAPLVAASAPPKPVLISPAFLPTQLSAVIDASGRRFLYGIDGRSRIWTCRVESDNTCLIRFIRIQP